MRLNRRYIPIVFFFAAAAVLMLPKAKDDGKDVQPQAIRIAVVESSLSGTVASDAVLGAIQGYADASQGGRYRKYDFDTTRDRNGTIPAEAADFYADFGQHKTDGRRLYIAANDTGKAILSCPLPADAASAVALLRKYGG